MPNLQRKHVRYEARLFTGTVDPAIEVVEVRRSLGGRETDSAVLEYRLDRVQPDIRRRHLRDVDLSILPISIVGRLMNAECEVTRQIGGSSEVVHFGRIDVANWKIENDESLRLTSRFEKHLFGQRLVEYQLVQSPIDRSIVEIHEPVVFNPQIDGVFTPNLRTPIVNNQPVFIHPESVRTIGAGFYQKLRPIFDYFAGAPFGEAPLEAWDLAQAVRYLCVRCNEGEGFIKNPSLSDLARVLPASKALLKNHKIDPGLHLPQALDELLEPYGFTWFVEYVSPGQRRIVVRERGKGYFSPVQLRLQQPGEKLDTKQSDVEDLDVTIDVGAVVNAVAVFGDYTQIEATFELIPGWKEEYDTTPPMLLSKAHYQWQNNPHLHDVHRKWVLNEDATYNGFHIGTWPGGPYGLDSLFQQAWGQNFEFDHPQVVPRRRKFLPTLTVRQPISPSGVQTGGENTPIGEVGGITVQWWNPNRTDDGSSSPGWVDIDPSMPGFSCEVLDNECGIRFNGVLPPLQLVSGVIKRTARVRVIATIQSDSAIAYGAERRPTSLTRDFVWAIVEDREAFHWRKVVRQGAQASIYAGSKFVALEADGRAAIKQAAELLRNAWDLADVSGTVTIEGLDRPEYRLGETITGVVGRNVLLAASTDPQSYRLPQIAAEVHKVQEQRLVLQLQTVRPPATALLSRVMEGGPAV